MTPRERDPMVWAAAYGAAFGREFAAVYTATDDGYPPGERLSFALASASLPAALAKMTAIADAAVMALHPEPPEVDRIREALNRCTWKIDVQNLAGAVSLPVAEVEQLIREHGIKHDALLGHETKPSSVRP